MTIDDDRDGSAKEHFPKHGRGRAVCPCVSVPAKAAPSTDVRWGFARLCRSSGMKGGCGAARGKAQREWQKRDREEGLNGSTKEQGNRSAS